MRLCRYQHNGNVQAAFYFDDGIVSLAQAAAELNVRLPTPTSDNLLDFLPPEGKSSAAVAQLYDKYQKLSEPEQQRLRVPLDSVRLRVPVALPRKVILLAGNYAEHIREGGGQAPEQRDTFPYFFWKPPSTTLTHPGDPIRIPRISPDHIDWEIELGVVIGRRCSHVSEKDALGCVAGYTVCNDVSDRQFRLNPNRKPREKDSFFDWLHGKWHDTFLPMGPCIRAASTVSDPQQFRLRLSVDGKLMQDSSTAHMIFPVASVVAILSSFVTLEPGDVISTGTPSGVGAGRQPPVFLRSGQVVDAEIAGIGSLRNPVV